MRTILLTLLFLCSYNMVISQSATVVYGFYGDATDLSGNSNHGTLSPGTSAMNALKIGNNIADYLTVPAVSLDGLTDFSIIFKIKFNGLHTTGSSPTNHIFSGSRPGSVQCFGFSYEKNANGWLIAVNGIGHYWPDASIVPKKWYCMSLTRTGSTITLYKNGVSLGTFTNASVIDITSLVVGQEDDCVGGCFAANQSMWGHLDNFQIWNSEKTDCSLNINGEALAGTDVKDHSLSEYISVYPNPASGQITLTVDNSIRIHTLRIFDSQGNCYQTITDLMTASGRIIADVSSLPNGIYLIELSGEDGVGYEKVVVVR